MSFDIFDTLLLRRDTTPESVMGAVAEQIKADAKEFISKRKEAECQARLSAHGGEVTLDDIYSYLRKDYPTVNPVMEIEAELDACAANDRVLPLFEWALANRCVVLTSDMYLDSATITSMLAKAGITGYEKVFVSNECGCDKRSCGLFRHVAKDLGVDTSDIAHIGDSLKADILGARKAGVKPIFIPKRHLAMRMIRKILKR